MPDRDDGPPSTVSLDVVRRTFGTNLSGNLAVLQAMLLRESTERRVFNVSSSLGSLFSNADPGRENAAVRIMGDNASKAAARH